MKLLICVVAWSHFQKKANSKLELSSFLIHKVESSTVYAKVIPGP